MLSLRAAILLLACARTSALDNGFVKPALGWSSWYAAPEGSQVTEEFVKGSATALISSGLAAKGYVYVRSYPRPQQSCVGMSSVVFVIITKN